MVDNLVRDGVLADLARRAAFLSVDRADFVPEAYRGQAYLNEPLPIGWGQTISQPWTVAFMLNLLEPQPGERILDIGSGSGWQAALLAYLVSSGDSHHRGKVYALEIIPELARGSLRALAKYRFIHDGILEVHCLDAKRGYPAAAPFDKIIAAAALSRAIPPAWVEQLKIGGRLVAPVGGEMIRLTKTGESTATDEHFPRFAFVPFREEN